MTRKDRMLQLVLTDEKLIKKFEVEPEKYPTIHDALYAGNPIVSSVAIIIDSINDTFEESDIKNLYTKIQHHLYDTLLI